MPRPLSRRPRSYNIVRMELTSLFLAPKDARARPDATALVELLKELDVIGQAIGTATFLAGHGFARHIVFAGCSPHLVMQPPTDGSPAFCHVAVHGPYPEPRLVTGPNTVKPRCPQCRGRFGDWRQRLEQWNHGDPAVCAQCGSSTPASRLDWRQHAIGASLLLEMRHVFPGEASPSDHLLQRLEQTYGQPWRYAWAGMLLAD
ncbi:MAG: hypothetical protein KDI88_10435 [Gammaproteobacteria bacterium]|nr:hypothetical protein [Gammaproteobacteria bacterium]